MPTRELADGHGRLEVEGSTVEIHAREMANRAFKF